MLIETEYFIELHSLVHVICTLLFEPNNLFIDSKLIN